MQNTEVTLYKMKPSYFGRIINTAYGEVLIFHLMIPTHIIDTYLPDLLPAYPEPLKISDRIKSNWVYSAPMLTAARSQLNDEMENLSSLLSEVDLLEQLLPKQMNLIRCNMVILNDRIILARISQTYKIPYYLLLKHITLANRSTHTRFAGELWRGENDSFYINNNSGTYRPPNELIESTVSLFDHLFPFLNVQGFSWEESARPPTFDRFKFKVRQKVTCS